MFFCTFSGQHVRRGRARFDQYNAGPRLTSSHKKILQELSLARAKTRHHAQVRCPKRKENTQYVNTLISTNSFSLSITLTAVVLQSGTSSLRAHGKHTTHRTTGAGGGRGNVKVFERPKTNGATCQVKVLQQRMRAAAQYKPAASYQSDRKHKELWISR